MPAQGIRIGWASPAWWMAAAAIFLGAVDVAAVPTYAARTGFTCVTCHFDPNGGGPRKEMGFLFERQRHDLTPDPCQRWQGLAELTNRLSDWFYFGTNTRMLYLYDDADPYGALNPPAISTFFQMETALHATLRPHPNLLVSWTLDFGEFSGSKTRDAYGMIDGLPQGLYLRAGRFRNPFGLRQDDHTAATRFGFLNPASGSGGGVLPYDPREPQSGVEVGANPGMFFGSLALTNARGAFSDRVNTVALKWGVNHRPLQVGVSGYDAYLSSTGARNLRWGGYGLFGWRDLTVRGEIVGGEDRDPGGTVTRVAGTFVEADYRFRRWLLISGRYDFVDRNRDLPGFAAERFGGDAIFTPVPFADLRIGYRRIVPETAGDENQALAMWHFYY